MSKPVYLGMSILDISKRLIYKFCYDYFKPKYGDVIQIEQNYVIQILIALLFIL